MITLRVPGMSSRQQVRQLTARIRDLPGVDAVEANLRTAVLVVHGDVAEHEVRDALGAAGFACEHAG